MGKITFFNIKEKLITGILLLMIFALFGLVTSFGKATLINSASINLEPVYSDSPLSMVNVNMATFWSPFSSIFNSPINNMEFFGGNPSKLNSDSKLYDTPPCLSDPAKDCDGDGVTNEKEVEDDTDPLNPCDFILAHQNCSPSAEWKSMDCDRDGVINEKEIVDGTDFNDSCDLKYTSMTKYPSYAWKKEDCDGDGVANWQEVQDKTDPTDPCEYLVESITMSQCGDYLTADCDGDGVTNEKENEDDTDPLNPCDFILAHQNCSPTPEWKAMDCDGDGVTNEKEKEDGTDPLDPCDFILAHQNCSPSVEWKAMDCDGDGVINDNEKEDGTDPSDSCDLKYTSITILPSYSWKKGDCDGDGVTNWQEVQDKTDPTDPCDYLVESITLPQGGAYLTADCDGDGVTNEKEVEDGTDPLNPCEFILEHQTVPTTSDWNALDCDGDGVTNEDEKEDGTDPLDPCSYDPESVTLPQGGAYLTADCDGDGVTNEKEKEDGTDPLDPCEFILDHQTVPTTSDWNTLDCDGDGVTNEDEKEDGTDPLDPCSYDPESVTLPQSGAYLAADCDGDGVTNEDEKEDGTDPLDPCEFILEHQTVPTTSDWNTLDCDGDGVTNEDEKEDGTDPLDPCSYDPESVTLTPSAGWEALDCDDDGNPNGTDPDPLVATARDDSGSTPALTEVTINILENDDYLPNNDPNNLGTTSLSQIGGTAVGSVVLNAETGILTYIPTASESNTIVTIIYEVCNIDPDPSVCASATVSIQVMANTLDAVDDSFNGSTDGGTIPDSNVLTNDTLNGVAVTPKEVTLTSTPTDQLTINEDGSINVTPGIAEGTYTIDYTICEVADPTNCDSAKVTIKVGPAMGNTLDAVDDSFNGSTAGGTIPDSNVLTNDMLNGVSVTPEEVTLTSAPTDQLTINEDGSINVTPGIAEGTYTIDYTICEVADPTNCDSATVTMVVVDIDEDEKIEVNQLVTPNADGKNDFLFIRGVRNAKNNSLQIYNRWGVAVYKGSGYNNQNNVFDGRSKGRSTVTGSDYLPAGVYYYIFQYENNQRNVTDSGYIYMSQ